MLHRFIRSEVLPLIALGSLALAGASIAQPERAAASPQGQPPAAEPGAPPPRRPRAEVGQTVEECMKAVNRAARQLKDQVGDAGKKEENLKLIWAMQKNALQAKTMEPSVFSEAEKATLLPQYRKDQNELMRMLLKLEDEVADGKGADAAKTFEAIGQKRDAEHTKFKVKD